MGCDSQKVRLMNLINQGNGSSLNKEEAWEKFVKGEEAAFGKVFKAYYKEMYGYGLKICDEPELVKDCIQDLFRIIWKRRSNLDHINSPNVYLFVSLRRKVLKKSTSDKKKDVDLNEVDDSDVMYFGKEELIIQNEAKIKKKEKLQEALNQLSSRKKEVIYLRFYNGMSYGEIEQILSINRQSVRNHVYRAMETLRSLLDKKIMRRVVSLLIVLLFV